MIVEITRANRKHTLTYKVKLMDGRKPEWDERCKLWRVPGYRWIKTTQKFSGNALGHSGDTMTVVED